MKRVKLDWAVVEYGDWIVLENHQRVVKIDPNSRGGLNLTIETEGYPE